MATPAVKSFNAGELSPLLYGRTDLEKYGTGCKQLRNMIPLIQGAVTRRPGTEYIADCKATTTGATQATEFGRLIPFSRSDEISYMLEFGENYIRVYNDGARVNQDSADAYVATNSYKPGDWVTYGGLYYYCIQAGIGLQPDITPTYWSQQSIYEVWTPWTKEETLELQFVQSIDVMYIVHPSHEVHKLSSTGTTGFTLEKVDFTYEAFLDENIDTDARIKVSTLSGNLNEDWIDEISYPEGAIVRYSGASYIADRDISEYEDYGNPAAANAPWTTPIAGWVNAGSLYRMTSSGYTFTDDDVGKNWLFKIPREDSIITGKITTSGVRSDTLAVKGDWSLTTHGTWTGTLELERSYDGGVTWVSYKVYDSTNDANYEDSGTEEVDDVLYSLIFNGSLSGSCTYTLDVNSPYNHRVYKIVQFDNAGQVVVQSKQDITSDEINFSKAEFYYSWAEGAWGGEHGYPRSISIFEERLCFGGNLKKPTTIWTSKINDYENLTTGVLDTDAIIYTISSEKVYAINWLVSQKVLLIGTSGDEWTLGASRLEEAMSPTNIKGSRQSTYGSEYIQPLLINNSVFYIQRGARKVREMAYNWQEESYVSNDLTALSEHITDGGISQLAFMNNPHPILWVLLDTGKWAGFTYEKEQQVYAWHLHDITNFDVKSIGVIPGSSNNDEFYLVASRKGQDHDDYYVIKMADFNYDEVYDEYNGDTFSGVSQKTTPPPLMSSAFFLDLAKQQEVDNTIQILNGQNTYTATAVSPYSFTISGHGFSNGNKVLCYPDINYPTTESYFGEIFTIADVSGDDFNLKTEDGSAYFSGGDYNFDYTLFVQVSNSELDQDYWHGDDIKAIVDGRIDYEGAATAGSYTSYGDKRLLGLPYTSKVQPMSMETELADGASQARRKIIRQVQPRFYETIGATVETNDGVEMEINWRSATDAMDTAPPLYSGYKEVYFKDGYDKHADVIIKTDLPYPMTLLLIQYWIQAKN